jgi:hypothetical protein
LSSQTSYFGICSIPRPLELRQSALSP